MCQSLLNRVFVNRKVRREERKRRRGGVIMVFRNKKGVKIYKRSGRKY